MRSEETEVCVARTGKRIPIVMQDRQGRSTGRATLEFNNSTAGPEDAGVYSFWAVVQQRKRLFTVRTREGRTVENRINKYTTMSADAIYALEHMADAVMPATCSEIKRWVAKKPDASFAMWPTLKCVETS